MAKNTANYGTQNSKKEINPFKPAEISENAQIVLKHRYLLKDSNSEVCETPDQLFRRVANALAKQDKKYGKTNKQVEEISDKFYKALYSKKESFWRTHEK